MCWEVPLALANAQFLMHGLNLGLGVPRILALLHPYTTQPALPFIVM